MKKYLLIAVVATLGLAFTACGGKKGEKAEKVEDAVEAVTTTAENDVIAKYEAVIDKAIELQAKVLSGDVSVAEQYSKLGEEIVALTNELQEASANLTEEQLLKMAALSQKWADALQKAAQP